MTRPTTPSSSPRAISPLIIKIGRDKQVKWILGSPEGWKGDFAKKVLKPVDKNGKPITCEGSTCEGDFDWTWTQHTGLARSTAKSDKATSSTSPSSTTATPAAWNSRRCPT